SGTELFCGQIRQGGDESRRSVQRLRAPQAQLLFIRKALEADIDVVEHLDVIADKANRSYHHALVPVLFQFEHGALHRWSQPATAGHALALKSELLQLRR